MAALWVQRCRLRGDLKMMKINAFIKVNNDGTAPFSELIYGDAAEALTEQLAESCVDLVVTSPPYDDLRKYNGVGDSWNEEKFKEIARGIYRVVKPGGVVVWVVNDKTEGGGETGTSFKQALYFMELGFKLNDTMIWRKTNPMPQVKQPRYTQCFEYMFAFSKGKPNTFTPIMRETKFGGMKYNSTAKNMGGESGRHKLDYTVNNLTPEYNVWDIAVAQNKTIHPAVFPSEIALRHIMTWTKEEDTVLDPFMGSGTTGIAALSLGRNFIGVELNEEYYNDTLKRFEEECKGSANFNDLVAMLKD